MTSPLANSIPFDLELAFRVRVYTVMRRSGDIPAMKVHMSMVVV